MEHSLLNLLAVVLGMIFVNNISKVSIRLESQGLSNDRISCSMINKHWSFSLNFKSFGSCESVLFLQGHRSTFDDDSTEWGGAVVS